MLKLKKHCRNCKALEFRENNGIPFTEGYYCNLNYLVLNLSWDYERAIPMEQCSKPKTDKEFLRLLRERIDERN